MQSFSGPFDTFVIFLGSTVCLNYKITSWWNPWQAFKGIGTLTSSKASILVLTMMEVSLGFASLPLALPTFKRSAFFAIKDAAPVQSSSPAGTALEKYIPPCKRDWPQASWISDHLFKINISGRRCTWFSFWWSCFNCHTDREFSGWILPRQ